jgi:hypothetical protein
MFNEFFYLLKSHDLNISMKEWLTLMEAMRLGLHNSTLTGFYRLCLAVLCKSESDYDKFQQAFLEFFHDADLYDEEGVLRRDIPEEMMEYVNNPKGLIVMHYDESDVTEEDLSRSKEEIEEMLQDRIKNQKSQHDGGNYYVGTAGISPFGNMGFNPNGIRVGGTGTNQTALRVAGEREFRDFREDNVLDIRQFQMAFRRLRSYSNQNGAEQEFDVDKTIEDTCKKAGILQIRYKKPRKNAIRVLLLMDSGGSMAPHSQLCSRLFQAASKANRFKDLKVYYFHNCISEFLHTDPTLKPDTRVFTSDVLRQCDGDWRVIIVGDATMEMDDLNYRPPRTEKNKGFNGREWLKYILGRYDHAVWLNPYLRNEDFLFGAWGEAYRVISGLFPMYHLSVAGLEQAMKKLMVAS